MSLRFRGQKPEPEYQPLGDTSEPRVPRPQNRMWDVCMGVSLFLVFLVALAGLIVGIVALLRPLESVTVEVAPEPISGSLSLESLETFEEEGEGGIGGGEGGGARRSPRRVAEESQTWVYTGEKRNPGGLSRSPTVSITTRPDTCSAAETDTDGLCFLQTLEGHVEQDAGGELQMSQLLGANACPRPMTEKVLKHPGEQCKEYLRGIYYNNPTCHLHTDEFCADVANITTLYVDGVPVTGDGGAELVCSDCDAHNDLRYLPIDTQIVCDPACDVGFDCNDAFLCVQENCVTAGKPGCAANEHCNTATWTCEPNDCAYCDTHNDDRYVNVAGDYMTGSLIVQNLDVLGVLQTSELVHVTITNEEQTISSVNTETIVVHDAEDSPYDEGRIGVGENFCTDPNNSTCYPKARLHIQQKPPLDNSVPGFMLEGAGEDVGYILTTDGTGVGVWLPPPFDEDTLRDLTCSAGEIAKYNGATWLCAPDDNTDTDTLATLSCLSGNIIRYDGTQWVCSVDSDTIAALSCSTGQVAKWDGSAWVCADDLDTDTLATLTCSNGEIAKWNGAAWACAVDLDTLGSLSCTVNQIAKWDGSAWVCANNLDTDTLAALSCASGEIAKWDGSAWVCSVDLDTLGDLSCAIGQMAKWTGSAWVCANDVDTNTDTLAALSCSTSQIARWSGTAWICSDDWDSLADLSCAIGQVAKWNGAAWICADDVDTDTLATLLCASGQIAKWDGSAWSWTAGRRCPHPAVNHAAGHGVERAEISVEQHLADHHQRHRQPEGFRQIADNMHRDHAKQRKHRYQGQCLGETLGIFVRQKARHIGPDRGHHRQGHGDFD